MKTEVLQKWEAEGASLIDSARSLTITDQISREKAAEFTINARRVVKIIEDEFKPDIKSANDLHKSLLSRMNNLTLRYKEAKGIVDKKISDDYFEQEKIRRENERIAQEKADAERKAQEEALAKAAEEAIEAEDFDKAEEIMDTVVPEIVAPVAPEVQQSTRSTLGTATVRKDIKVELVDLKAALGGIIRGDFPETFVTVDLGAVKKYAKVCNLKSIPGFRITEVGVVSGRAF